MIVPTEEALQELWISHRVERAEREHRPHPDYSLFIAEFKEAIDKIKADAWDDCLELLESNSEIDLDDLEHYKQICPYRKQDEA